MRYRLLAIVLILGPIIVLLLSALGFYLYANYGGDYPAPTYPVVP